MRQESTFQKIFLVVFLLALWSCKNQPTKFEEIPVTTMKKNYFENREGCFLLYNVKTGAIDKIIGDENCKKAYPASSTFKVPLAVMAFDSGVLKNEKVVLKWDGRKDERTESNKDHDARSWMRQSIVWFSKRLTPRIGEARLQKYLNAFDYGNKDLSAGITKAWLVSAGASGPALKITAYEQLEFMKKLWTDSLPVSRRSMELTQEITFLETSPKGFKMSGKTGSNFFDKEEKVRLGWFIAHVEKADREYITILNFRDLVSVETKSYGGLEAKEITKQILADEGIW